MNIQLTHFIFNLKIPPKNSHSKERAFYVKYKFCWIPSNDKFYDNKQILDLICHLIISNFSLVS